MAPIYPTVGSYGWPTSAPYVASALSVALMRSEVGSSPVAWSRGSLTSSPSICSIAMVILIVK